MDKSLDEILKDEKQGRGGFGNRGFGRNRGGRGGDRIGRRFEERPRFDRGGPRQNFNRRDREEFEPRGQFEARGSFEGRRIDGKGRAIKIFNLQPDINEQELYNLVAQYGPVEECKISRDPKGRSLENATVVYRDFESADQAKKELHRIDIEGRTVSVEVVRMSEVLKDDSRPREIQRRGLFRDTERRRDDRGRGKFFEQRGKEIPW